MDYVCIATTEFIFADLGKWFEVIHRRDTSGQSPPGQSPSGYGLVGSTFRPAIQPLLVSEEHQNFEVEQLEDRYLP